MKTIVALCVVALVSGCAGLPMQKAENDSLNCDLERMSKLERAAKQERASLHWVNCPQLPKNRAKA